MHNLREWMRHNGLPFVSPEQAIREPKVLALYRELVEAFNKFFNQVEQIKKFELLPYEWTIASGELTPTLKLKRKVVMEKYRDAVERIYS
jgi:long-chain acyl-CoA synthetase